MADSARGLGSAARWARGAGLTSAALLVLAACDLTSPPEEDPPKVELTSAAESVVVSDKVLLTASVPMADGAPTHTVTWSATAGALEPIDVHSLAVWFHAPDEPGDVTVTVTLETDPPVQDVAELTVEPASDPAEPDPEPEPDPKPEPEPEPEPVTLVAVGDIACPPGEPPFSDGPRGQHLCMQALTAAAALSLEPDAVITLGDLQYNEGSYSNFMNSYHLSWGALNDVVYPIPGGHEYDSGNADGYFQYFQEQGVWDRLPEGAGDQDRGYYSYDLGEWRVIALNSVCKEPKDGDPYEGVVGGCDEGSPQYEWFVDELEAAGERCVLVAMHEPRFNVGRNGDSDEVADIFQAAYDAGVDLMLTGDEHSYERFAPVNPRNEPDPNGVRIIISGTGGRSLYVDSNTYETSEKQIDGEYGVLRVDLYADRYEIEFVPAQGYEGEDSGSFDCI